MANEHDALPTGHNSRLEIHHAALAPLVQRQLAFAIERAGEKTEVLAIAAVINRMPWVIIYGILIAGFRWPEQLPDPCLDVPLRAKHWPLQLGTAKVRLNRLRFAPPIISLFDALHGR